MAGKRLTPLLGGSAAVWTTCLVFFQTALLLGYLCAHWMATRLRPRMQALVYLALLGGSVVQVVANINPNLHASTARPISSVFLVLSALIGLPFLTLSATNPLLQSWYARGFANPESNGNAAATTPPYRLFALSNFGSLLGLVVYPWLIEPRFTLHSQAVTWLGGFLFFALVCSTILWRLHRSTASSSSAPKSAPDVTSEAAAAGGPAVGQQQVTPPSNRDRALWLLLAACGSLMLSAITNHISQNIAAIPLMWIIPLTIYLLTFVLAFSSNQKRPGLLSRRIPGIGVSVSRLLMMAFLAIAVGATGFLIYDIHWTAPFQISILFFCLALFTVCLFCHRELHHLRPAPQYATSFYLLIATGGALGSMFVGILAPVIFPGNYELVCGLVFTSALAVMVVWREPLGWRLFWAAVTVAMLTVVYSQIKTNSRNAVAQMRSFYGTLRITQTIDTPQAGATEKPGGAGAQVAPLGATRVLVNGTIKHGVQVFTEELRREPTSYYTRDSGVGMAMEHCCGDRPRRVGVIGLGAGTMAAYGKPGDVIRFYDINPQVERVARSLFSYLTESQATIEVVLGDARISLANEPSQNYDVLVVDAFSGDAIPVHLLTREAIALYRRHLKPDGILAVHVSSQYLSLPPVVLQQAQNAGLQAWLIGTEDHEDQGTEAYASDWVLVSANAAFFKDPAVDAVTEEISPLPGLRLWTDDYNSLLPLLKYDKLNAFSHDASDE